MVCGCYGVAMWLIIGPSVSVIWEFSRCFIVQQVKILHNSRTHTHTLLLWHQTVCKTLFSSNWNNIFYSVCWFGL